MCRTFACGFVVFDLCWRAHYPRYIEVRQDRMYELSKAVTFRCDGGGSPGEEMLGGRVVTFGNKFTVDITNRCFMTTLRDTTM